MAITQETNYAMPKLDRQGLRQVVDEVAIDLHLIPGVGLRNAIANQALEEVYKRYPTHQDFLTSEQKAEREWNRERFAESFIQSRLEHYSGRSRK